MYKCKMCGAQIVVSNNESSLTCEFCGTRQTVPTISADNIKLSALHNRANSLRMEGEFDQALSTYENIVNENPNDAEAHWGIVLCRYGIEYVDDPKTGKKVITCRRTELKSVFDDIDYKAAIDNSDVVAKRIYQAEAEQINVIQKGILVISQHEKPFDIFISYKETDEHGKRTRDSVIAQEIYNELTARNYRVFFSRITLESKLGSQYEPYIFSALNSAKVMLVIGTKESYFNSVWVRNEWSRFLSLINTNIQKKYIIPCYRDVDVYKLPIELVSFQSQDMNKLGFVQDLIRGIDKLFNKREEGVKIVDPTFTESIFGRNNTSALLRRSEILINDGEFEKAEFIIDELLNSDPENSKAYFLLLLIELEVNDVDELISMDIDLSEYVNYERALRYADKDFAAQLSNIPKAIADRIEFEKNEVDYNKAIFFMNSKKYELAIELFNKLGDFKDSSDQTVECVQLFNEETYNEALSYKVKNHYDLAISLFLKNPEYKDSKAQVNECEELKKTAEKEAIYLRAKIKIFDTSQTTVDKLKNSISLFQKIIGYKDVGEQIVSYEATIVDMEQQLTQKQQLITAKKAKNKKIGIFSFLGAILLVGIILLTNFYIVPITRQNKIQQLIDSGDYENAKKYIEKNGDFGKTEDLQKMILGGQYFENLDYESGIDVFYQIGGTIDVNYDDNGLIIGKTSETIKKSSKYINNDSESQKVGFDFSWTLTDYKIISSKYYVKINLKAGFVLHNYSINYNLDGGIQNNPPTSYTVKDTINIPSPTKQGYSFIGWTELGDDHPIINYTINEGTVGNKTLTANWSVNSYKLKLFSNDEDKGSVSENGDGNYAYSSEVKITAIAEEGYRFNGWYEGDVLFSSSNPYVFSMPYRDVNLTAKFGTKFPVHVDNLTDEAWGYVEGAGYYDYGEIVTLTATPYSGYYFKTWLDDKGVSITNNATYTFTMPKKDVLLGAKFTDVWPYGVGDIFSLGLYPQTKVTDLTLVSELNNSAGTLPTSTNSRSWKSYNYYINGSNTTNFMWYQDVSVGTERYRGVYFTSYRPDYTTSSSSGNDSHQDNNGYYINTRYWFKFEPISWDVLSVNKEDGLLLSSKILDNQDYYHSTSNRTISEQTVYANNYNESNVRKWLNNGFLNSAFSSTEQTIIKTTHVDNSAYSTGVSPNQYVTTNTDDKVFLPSYREVINQSYGFYNDYSRERVGTDYAKAMGLYVVTSNENSPWWLRGPHNIISEKGTMVGDNGLFYNSVVNYTIIGVLPSLRIKI